ncbi:flavoprotein [Rhodococcus sp. (in: high G+C Gram-positive bacteria)]|uniref:flavoprotein n=1 Tax=Rhodococcus sp. TaxID=1831 RepID=UPI003B8A9911
MRLLVFATGTLNTCFLPVAVNWMRATRPDIDVRIVLSQSATAFVSPVVLATLSRNPVAIDTWDDPVITADGPAPHTGLTDYDAMLVYPASLNTVSRLHALAGDTPVLNAAQCTNNLVVVAPNFPPGAQHNRALSTALTELASRPNFMVVDPILRPSASTGADAPVAPPLWDVMAAIDLRLAEPLGAVVA